MIQLTNNGGSTVFCTVARGFTHEGSDELKPLISTTETRVFRHARYCPDGIHTTTLHSLAVYRLRMVRLTAASLMWALFCDASGMPECFHSNA